MPTLVLVHSPLVGPLIWQQVAERLRRRSHQVVVPSLLDAPATHRGLASAAAADVTGPAVLVGHSGAGALLPAVAQVVGDVPAMVFVDALLPHPGVSWFDTAPAELRERLLELTEGARLPPWNEWLPRGTLERLLPDPALRERFVAELPRMPLTYFEEPAPAVAEPLQRRHGYLLLSEPYAQTAEQAARRGWLVRREVTDHLAPLTRPDLVADRLEDMVRQLLAG
ncbi:Alpha/beta hydrolase family protein [Amycolatopsis arida]|uniref:Alpha/beta hydrolase family protein n=1 Tax=Amycolatopsis arida TaxID=587909 RepID=A0A1I5T4Y4_9PSEU|nr:alpha/beta fold hydrolase [Amycolatopsis arida]TDX96228.1 alpha/beta hydrolase family protein [Amycolatopsis arida]SFP78089.1 Alpha/beta hydrolase family protein [Amycolatopsis arida]